MTKKKRSRPRPAATPAEAAAPAASAAETAAAAVVAFAAAAIPIAFWPLAANSYRLPKALLFRATGIALVAIAAIELVWRGRLEWPRAAREPFLVAAAAVVVWWGIAAAAASNRLLSFEGWLWIVNGAVFAVAAYLLAARRGMEALVPLLAGGVVNGVSCLLAFVLPLSMFWPQVDHRAYALLGSAHDAGTFFVFPALAAAAAAVVDRRRRIWWIAAAALPVAGIVATRTLGAAVALAAGVVVLLWCTSRKAALAAMAAVVVLAVASLALPAVRTRAAAIRRADVLAIDQMLSGRIVPFLAAGRMFARHPLLGVGPGCFAWEYFPEKVAIEGEHPLLIGSDSRYLQFGEAHSDHLQILAETGLPGYALFIAALLLLAGVSRRRGAAGDGDVRARFARTAGAPLAAAIAVVALAEFPFELAAPTVAILYFAAICIAWSRIDALA